MPRSILFSAVCLISLIANDASADTVGSYSGCKPLRRERAACERCVGAGSFYQPGQGCGTVEGMHKSKAVPTAKPPPRPTKLAKNLTEYVTITPKPFAPGSRTIDANKNESKDVFEGALVTLTHPFSMRTTEVTQGEWYMVTGALTSSYDKECGLNCPVGAATFMEILTFLNMLSKRDNLEPCYALKNGLAQWTKGFECNGYRLPTDAEWEYAARGGSDEPVYGELDKISWHNDNSGGKPHPVATKSKNAYGLYDMLGNSWESVWDIEEFVPYKGEMTDPIGGGLEITEQGTNRMLRGGSYKTYTNEVRATVRYQATTNNTDDSFGFRPVRTVAK